MEYGCGIAGRAAAMTAAAHAVNPDCHVMVTRKHFPGTKTLSLAAALAGGVNGENAAAYARAGADMLVTSWVYFGKPFDIKMKIEAI